jgi:molybdenum cofactor guanylyltransferase
MAVSGAVLAGGASRRMGADKRLIAVDGVPLLARAVSAVQEVCDEVLVIAPDDPVGAPARVVADLRPGQGPLAGLETAIAAARHPLVLVVATDHPWLSPAVLGLLVDRLVGTDAPAVMLGTDRGPQPLVAAYRRQAGATITSLLDAGERRAVALVHALGPVIVHRDEWMALDPTGDTARDVDQPADLPDASRG